MPYTSDRPRTSGSGSRFGGGPRRSGRPGGPRRSGGGRPRQSSGPSPLEQALIAAVEAPAPADQSFAELGLPRQLVTALAGEGMEAPFAIQTRVLPDALAKRDVLGRAQTGSGKTLAFGIPVLARLAAEPKQRVASTPRAIILVPTRELARQVNEALNPLARPLGLRVTTVVGGLSISRQMDALRRGVDVVVATPGRLIDLMDRRAANLSQVEISVLDEADHMADLGFLPAVRRILDATPADTQRLLLSATLDGGVDKLVTEYLTDPAFHAVKPTTDAATAMDHKVFSLSGPAEKLLVASEIAVRPARTIFFVRTKHGADRLARQLSRAGADATAIHGNLNQNQRQRALDAFAAGSPRVLVATDVAARGIHVDDVDLVVHYDLPGDHKDYLHRSGRTARAGARGTVVAFTEPGQGREINRLHRDASVTATTDEVHPGHAAVREIAESGEPVEVRPLAPQRPERRGGGAGGGGQRRRSGGGSGGHGGGYAGGGAGRGGSGSGAGGRGGRPAGSRPSRAPRQQAPTN
ncbi:DEAD/DEAH box helicase [Kineosporia sp. J2-2]|uniref:DEAD/DEAH box helicase n=1 Tax=Kineosporia corallincola TaxID=2835133 RepID=A0ABS5TTB1_9ACTN|nr:DEAD/DEAH box helicase [Kineosporia corallincola]MBT0774057.1 DEAD/DEAH box helicase [Kineosporia corallincola]